MKKSKIILSIFCCFLLFLGFICFLSANWYGEVYGDTGFDSVIYTLFSDMGGVMGDFFVDYILNALVPALIITAIVAVLLLVHFKRSLVVGIGKKLKLHLYPFSKITALILAAVISLSLIYTAADRVGMIEYIRYMNDESSVFQEYYVDPKEAKISFPEKKRNLIYIYLESLETSFLSYELGGGNDLNPIPELYDLAKENTNFSYNDSVGGFSSLSGSTWTIGAMVSHTAGIPLKTSINVDGNSYGQSGEFLPGVTTLSDVLHKNGYYQALMVGSDADFGGRRQYYESHGTDRIYDLYTAREDGIIPEDYYAWWGFEDAYLFEYAKRAIADASSREQPFAFTMLTVDTHHVGGYVCKYCKKDFPNQYENVLACSSRQVIAFVEWIKQQDFYENTTVIVCGDHPTMDNDFVSSNITADYKRRVYNCFINSAAEAKKTKNREFCSFDLFPSTLSALGCTIEGGRLGLGTDLFSPVPTLCEVFGTEAFDAEVAKNNDYYAENFY